MWSRALGGFAALVALIAVATVPAHAQVEPPPGQPAVQSWAVAPSGEDPSTPGARTDLSYSLEPGASVDDSVTVFNYGNVQLTLRLYATDAYNTATGQFDLLEGDKPPTDTGTWVTLPQGNVTVPASSSLVVPIKITVPQNASPGDHAGAILASSQITGSDDQNHKVGVDRRTGTRLYIRVAGPLNPALVVEKVHASYSGGALNPLGGKMHVTYTVRNAGNIRLAAHQKISVKGFELIGTKNKHLDDLPELLPGNAITLSADLKPVAAAVRSKVEVRVSPFSATGGDTGGPSNAVATTHVWTVPWSALLIGVLILVGWRRARRGRGRAAGAPPSATSPRVPVSV